MIHKMIHDMLVVGTIEPRCTRFASPVGTIEPISAEE